jgi:hypothetical protein
MQKTLHENPDYGVSSVLYAPVVDLVISQYQIKEILDYGAGKCRLRDALENKIDYYAYEPSNAEWNATPEPRELVACIDVLEHIEPECLDDVLDDLRRCVLQYGIFTIHTAPAQKILPDGRNAHLIQEHPDWWKEKLNKRFTIIKELNIGNGFIVLVKKDK